MNTKYKSAARDVPKSVGRPVGILPIAPLAPKSGERPERRKFQKSISASSLSSLGSARSNLADASANKSIAAAKTSTKRRASLKETLKPISSENRKQDEKEDEGIKFIDMDASRAPATRGGGVSGANLTTDDILQICEETDPYKVYDINLHGEDLTKVPDLEKFRKLRALDLSGNHIKNISRLEFNKDLKELKLYDNEISVIEGLNNLKDLSILQLQHNRISSLGRGLGALKKLQTLRLDSNRLGRLETTDLLSCANISSLDLSNNKLQTLTPLSYLPNLEELFVSGNKLKTTSDLTKCRKLQEVDLSLNLLEDLSGLQNLPHIQILDVSKNQLKDLSSLGKLKSLEELNVSENQISELSPFVGAFPRLQILTATDNVISSWTDVCSLSACDDLVELFVTGNPFTLEDGEMPSYHQQISMIFTKLEIIDGAAIRRNKGKTGAPPVMRPMSAASIITVKQVDNQMKALAQEQDSLEKSITERFESIKSLFSSLPVEAPTSARSVATPPDPNRCSSRARLREAKQFAEHHFTDGTENNN